MTRPNEPVPIVEYTRKNGETMTLVRKGRGFGVDMWDKDGHNLWNRWYASLVKAQAEFDRWRD